VTIRIIEQSSADPPLREEPSAPRADGQEVGTGPACDFCGSGQTPDRRILPGPSVAICSECVAVCNEMLASG
jgi:hypothetical protein